MKYLSNCLKWLMCFLIIFIYVACNAKDTNKIEFITSNYGIVQYPVFKNIEGSEQVNDLIIDKVKSILDSNEEFDGSIQYSVLECNSEIISIEFYGDIIYLPTKRPLRIYSCMSIDVKNKKQIKLSDIKEINDDFINNYIEGLCLKYKEIHPNTESNPFGENSSYNMEYFKYYLNKADQLVYNNQLDRYLDSHIKSCIHENSIILSMELPQALGFHIEVRISLDDIK